MANPEQSDGAQQFRRRLSERERKILGYGGGLVGVLSGVAQFAAADGVRQGLRLLGISAGVVIAGVVVALGAIRLWQSGRREVTLRLNVVVLAMGLFVALGVVGGLVGHRLGVSARTESAGPQGGSTSTTPAPTPTASTSASVPTPDDAACDNRSGHSGVVGVRIIDKPADLVICPVLLNNGAPITGPFSVAGKFVGRTDLYRRLTIVNKGDPETCDMYGHPPAPGLFYARGLEIHDDGTWSFNDPLGYDEAVTIARTYEVVYASPASIAAIKNDRDAWNKAHHNSGDYPGMSTLPADAKVLATFRQPPGKYKGKGSPCKNT